MSPKKTHQLLRRARAQRNLSQKEVAEAIGTTVGNVSRWERQITSPAPYYRRKLCELFGKEASALGLQDEEGEEAQACSTLEMSAAFAPGEESLYDPAIPQPDRDDGELIGRDAFLEHLKEQLRGGQTLALHGLPGIGKTALALALVHDPQLQAHCMDGVLWAALGPQPNSASILSRWATLLDDGMIHVWCSVVGTPRLTWQTGAPTTTLGWSPDGKRITWERPPGTCVSCRSLCKCVQR